jgi:hypothetical protein
MKLDRLSKKQRLLGFFAITAVIFLLTSCANQPSSETYDPPGFFLGLIHGFLIVFSFIGSLFTDMRIYSFPNSGIWYDFGYLIGAGMFLGGSGASSNYNKR